MCVVGKNENLKKLDSRHDYSDTRVGERHTRVLDPGLCSVSVDRTGRDFRTRTLHQIDCKILRCPLSPRYVSSSPIPRSDIRRRKYDNSIDVTQHKYTTCMTCTFSV